ncbi:hypothetical protein B0H13DRAFT_1893043 [Mycena leptocephala]|nr:hypothetical protein B0H13DRAFT_1893043 [Mycena leptocephala]
MKLYHCLIIHLEITAKQSTLNFVVPNLEAIAIVDRGMEGKRAVVHMNSLVLAVLLRNQDNLKLFGSLADKDQTSLAKAFEEFGAHSQIKSVSKTEDHHYYSRQMHLYMLTKESEEMSKKLDSLQAEYARKSQEMSSELDSLQIDYDNMHSKMRVVQEDRDKCFADLEHLELEYAKLSKDLEKNEAETQRLENKHHVTSLVMGDQRDLATHWRDTNKDQEVKLEMKETQLSEMIFQTAEIGTPDEPLRPKRHVVARKTVDELQKLLSEKQQQNVRVEKELREFDKTKAELVNIQLAFNNEKNGGNEMSIKLQNMQKKILGLESKIASDIQHLDIRTSELTQSKNDCIRVQEELANTLQIVQVKDTKIRTLEEQLSSQSRDDNSSLADQTAILELREKNSEVLAEKKAALKQLETLILVLCGIAATVSRFQIRLKRNHSYISQSERDHHNFRDQLENTTIDMRTELEERRQQSLAISRSEQRVLLEFIAVICTLTSRISGLRIRLEKVHRHINFLERCIVRLQTDLDREHDLRADLEGLVSSQQQLVLSHQDTISTVQADNLQSLTQVLDWQTRATNLQKLALSQETSISQLNTETFELRAQLLQAQNSLDLVLQQPVVPHTIVVVLLEFHTAVLQRRNRLNYVHTHILRLEEEHRSLQFAYRLLNFAIEDIRSNSAETTKGLMAHIEVLEAEQLALLVVSRTSSLQNRLAEVHKHIEWLDTHMGMLEKDNKDFRQVILEMRENAVECQLQYQKLKTEHDTLHHKMGRLQDLSTKTNQAMKRLKIQSLQDKVWVLCSFFFRHYR